MNTRPPRAPETFDTHNPNDRYTTFQVGGEPGGLCHVGVFRLRRDPAGILTGQDRWEQIGGFTRNLGSDDPGPFYAFSQNGKDYALYSPDYTVTRVMSLPDCTDIAGEVDENGCGYCPLDFYVPRTPDRRMEFQYGGEPYVDRVNGQFGVVSGCYWGMESYNPIYYLDLSGITEGRFSRDDRFGSLEHHHEISLRDSIRVWDYTPENPIIDVAARIEVDTRKSFDGLDPTKEAERLFEMVRTAITQGPEAEAAALKALDEDIFRYFFRDVR